MRVSVIIVNWNTGGLLYNCIRSLKQDASGLIGKIYVVDNNSTDESLSKIEGTFERLVVIKNNKNLGYSKAINKALGGVLEGYILILNPDTEVCKGTLGMMVNYMENNPEVGMLGPKLVNSDGTFQLASKRSIPTPGIAFYKIIGLDRLFPENENFARYNLTFLDENKIQQVEAISGSCMLVRRKAVNEVGLLDEDFFMYGEDLDWCYRFGKSGWKIVYFPPAMVVHHHRASSRKRPILSTYNFYQAMYIFYKKHFKKKFVLNWFIAGSIITIGTFAITKNFIKKLMRGPAAPHVTGEIHEKKLVN